MIPKFSNKKMEKNPTSSLSLLSLLLFILLPNNLNAQPYTNISLGTTFTPLTPPKLSPSGDFAFGFRPLETNASLFLLAVWFNKIPSKTVVWTANRDTPVTNQSTAELTLAGQLSLKDPTGQEIWKTDLTDTAAYASMLDTGNFILAGADSGAVWESFGNPTDTILPGQVLSQPSTLYAKLMDDDYSTGRFEFTLQEDGNLVMYPVAYPTKNWYVAYWALMSTGSGIHLVFNESTGSLYLSLANNSRVPVLHEPGVTGENYLRATLDPDGVFRFDL